MKAKSTFLAATGSSISGSVGLSVCLSVCRFDLAFSTSNFNISAVCCLIELCFGYDTPGGLCYHISKAHDPIVWFRSPWGP